MNFYPISKGFASPLGTSHFSRNDKSSINFALFSRHATDVWLSLFTTNHQLIQEFWLNPIDHRTGEIWHIALEGLSLPFYYAYRLAGTPSKNFKFAYDSSLYLLDPYAKFVSTSHTWGATSPLEYQPKGVVTTVPPFDWQLTTSPQHALNELIIYEMHVRGFTQHPSSQVKTPGTFLGLIEKIPYLLNLGVNAIELLPVQEFNETENLLFNPETKKPLCNYWGYSTVNFFSAMNRYGSKNSAESALEDFKLMVREMHRHGIEVILDVVFNHTAEGNQAGPILSFKGIDNPIYYLQNSDYSYSNYSGCGNTFNCNHPIVWELILASLRYWVQETQVDGFRFDLSSILTRGRHGQLVNPAPLYEAISEDPLLAHIKLIAEPWDASGLYQLGHFASSTQRWSEWNDKYRDNIRDFIKGITGIKGAFSTRLCGSEDVYYSSTPLSSVNFITAHDGFSLFDLVSFNEKHNKINGEEDRDGSSQNHSWNCGCEGATFDPKINTLRQRQMRNLYLALFVSQGIPMIAMGDEYSHTKKGNNNTWCQDNELNWFIWDFVPSTHSTQNLLEKDLLQNTLLEEKQGFFRFCRLIIQFRKENPLLKRTQFLTAQEIHWHGLTPFKPDWSENHFIAFTLSDLKQKQDLFIAFNAQNQSCELELPEPPLEYSWHLIVDTSALSPQDIYEETTAPHLSSKKRYLLPYSALLLKAKSYSGSFLPKKVL